MTDLHDAIKAADGLFTQAGLSRRWKVSKAYVSEVVAREDFPAPVTAVDGDGQYVWAGSDADEWRATPRRPGPKAA